MINYLVVGGSHLQVDYIETVKSEGFKVHVVDYDPDCVGAKTADVFHCISIDDKDEILSLAKKLEISGIHSVATEQGNITANYVAEQLNLPCNGYQVALNTTDKSRMKKVLSKSGLATPDSIVLSSERNLNSLDVHYPVIVKASDRSAGRGVSLANNPDELLIAFRLAMQESFNKIVLVEEYIEGPQYSIETISSNGEHYVVAVTHMTFSGPPDFVERQHTLPAHINDDLRAKLEKYAFAALKAFEIRTGACHLEVRVRADLEISMIEIASRMGGWRHWMVEGALGIDYLKLILDSSLGRAVFFNRKKQGFSAIARTIVDQTDYDKYLQNKNGKEEIIADWVKSGMPTSKATNLIHTHGFYISLKEGTDYVG